MTRTCEHGYLVRRGVGTTWAQALPGPTLKKAEASYQGVTLSHKM